MIIDKHVNKDLKRNLCIRNTNLFKKTWNINLGKILKLRAINGHLIEK